MLKLYKKINDELHYWETWDKDNKAAIVHWGKVGDNGFYKQTEPGISNFKELVQQEIDKQLSEGYQQIDNDDHAILIIEYKIDDLSIAEYIEKRHSIEEKINQALGWAGLGKCDGGSIGSGTMEICCFVVDFQIAKNVIEQALKDTEYSDYSRIYDESKDS